MYNTIALLIKCVTQCVALSLLMESNFALLFLTVETQDKDIMLFKKSCDSHVNAFVLQLKCM